MILKASKIPAETGFPGRGFEFLSKSWAGEWLFEFLSPEEPSTFIDMEAITPDLKHGPNSEMQGVRFFLTCPVFSCQGLGRVVV